MFLRLRSHCRRTGSRSGTGFRSTQCGPGPEEQKPNCSQAAVMNPTARPAEINPPTPPPCGLDPNTWIQSGCDSLNTTRVCGTLVGLSVRGDSAANRHFSTAESKLGGKADAPIRPKQVVFNISFPLNLYSFYSHYGEPRGKVCLVAPAAPRLTDELENTTTEM